jgi:hypothetical protein
MIAYFYASQELPKVDDKYLKQRHLVMCQIKHSKMKLKKIKKQKISFVL